MHDAVKIMSFTGLPCHSRGNIHAELCKNRVFFLRNSIATANRMCAMATGAAGTDGAAGAASGAAGAAADAADAASGAGNLLACNTSSQACFCTSCSPSHCPSFFAVRRSSSLACRPGK